MANNQRSGRPSNLGLDPAGVRMIYVAGSMENYEQRLSTFTDNFQSAHANPATLAASGFYYTGFRDCSKCCNCGMGVNNWGANDKPNDTYFHGQGCRFVNSSLTNIERVEQNIPSTRHNQPRTVVSGIQTHEPYRHVQQPEPMEQNIMEPAFPCQHPCNPNMQELGQRLHTFRNVSWPNEKNIGVNELAEAGFFYYNEGDKVKCFYCNGGLQGWSDNDDPWDEHAKGFPHCEYLQNRKGPEFITNVNQRKETIRNAPSQLPSRSSGAAASTSSNVPVIGATGGSVTVEMTNTIKKQAMEMGFSKELIEKAYELQTVQQFGAFENLSSLLEILIRLEEDGN